MMADQILDALQRIEGKLDQLLAALADDAGEHEVPAMTLDGHIASAERDQTRSLG